MSTEQQTPRDEAIWKTAKKRINFRRSFFTYIVINIFLWGIWFFTNNDHDIDRHSFPWPVWVTLGWGIAIAFQYGDAYIFNGSDAMEKEYEKLKNKQ